MADTAAANGGSNIDVLKQSMAAYDSVSSGPVAQNVKDQQHKTANEFSNLAAARHTPALPAATGQVLTHYHSFFSELLSWNNPRASAIAYGAIVSLIFAIRYLDVLRWAFKITWMVLGVTIAAEVAGKTVVNTGLASQLRPRKYYTVPRETLDALIGDVHELVNFLVIEAQRIVFAENIWASVSVGLGAFISYWLVKIVPYWGLALITTTTVFFAPLIYTSNQELIDHHVKQVSDIVNAQTSQLRQIAGQQTAHATELTKQYVGDYTAKAQQILRGRSPETGVPRSTVKESDFPAAPKEVYPAAPQEEPFKAETVEDETPAAPVKAEEEEPLLS